MMEDLARAAVVSGTLTSVNACKEDVHEPSFATGEGVLRSDYVAGDVGSYDQRRKMLARTSVHALNRPATGLVYYVSEPEDKECHVLHWLGPITLQKGCSSFLPQYISILQDSESDLSVKVYWSIYNRLSVILDPDDLADENITPRKASFVDLIDFFVAHKLLMQPRLGITRKGNFIASWRRAKNMLVSLEFIGKGRIDWLIFAPNAAEPNFIETAAGEANFTTIMQRIRSFRAEGWMKNGHGQKTESN